METPSAAAVERYWIPVGAGGRYVRFNGRVFDTIEAALQRRSRCELYHAALVVELDGDRHTIELAPSPDADETSRGVVAAGPVGSRHRLTGNPAAARRPLALVAAGVEVAEPVGGYVA